MYVRGQCGYKEGCVYGMVCTLEVHGYMRGMQRHAGGVVEGGGGVHGVGVVEMVLAQSKGLFFI